MSESSPQPQEPREPNRNAPESTGVNWRLFGLLGVALLVLSIAYFNTDTFGGKTKQLTYNEFRNAYDQGLVVTDDTRRPFEVVTRDSLYIATVNGWLKPSPARDTNATKQRTRFQVPVDIVLNQGVLNRILGSEIKITRLDSVPTLPEGGEVITLQAFRKFLAAGEVQVNDLQSPLRVVIAKDNSAVIEGVRESHPIVSSSAPVDPKQYTRFEVKVDTLMQKEELSELLASGAKRTSVSNTFANMLISLLPIILIVAVLIFFFRQQMKSAGRGAMNFGRSKARLLTMDKNKVTFKDVAGIQEAKEELQEIVEFLRDPRKFQKLGGSIPKGVLMVGAPGTGKTLLARAIAGEADVPFFSISGSDFVEMFVGVGASRVRDMFEQGKKNAPCLIFIDEIDAVGRHRGQGMGGGNDEREQTLNQMLVEMDGFDTQEGVIIIAATNRPDVLDPALLRPGRFDRQVTVSLPDVNGREEILRVHAKKIKLQAGVDLSRIAKGTPGFSGAELANLINEAALLAARRNRVAVTIDELEEARDKVRWGRERRSLAMSDKEKIGTAWHEAGHAYLNVILKNCHPLHKVTIIPRGPYLGATMYLPDGDKYSTQKKEALDSLVMTMGGRIAEQFHSQDISNGAAGDIRQATHLARQMVCEWGMSEHLGMIGYSESEGSSFLGRDFGKSRDYSESTAQAIDAEIKKLIDDSYATAERLLNEGRDKVELIAMALLEYETLDASHVRDLVEFGEMKDPPPAPKPPPIPDELAKKDASKTSSKEESKDDGTIPGEVVGAPA
ncbi:MAG: ATP-dependent zinc metalloprotease FtsH [Akkermansiaceae bacterium]|jgi:cell division protease FtsH